jgi:mRNA interferase MazF
MDMVKRFEIWHVELNPTVGAEINKIRPCLVVSPDESNRYLNTVIIVPLTSTLRPYPTRINCIFKEKKGQLAVDQIRSIDKSRLVKKLGELDKETSEQICAKLGETFRY